MARRPRRSHRARPGVRRDRDGEVARRAAERVRGSRVRAPGRRGHDGRCGHADPGDPDGCREHGCRGAGAAASVLAASVWITRIGVPTSTVVPSSTRSSDTTPSNALGSSTSDFAVSISTNTWSSAMRSPGATRHCTISASVRPSPTSGNGNRISLICLPSQSIYSVVVMCVAPSVLVPTWIRCQNESRPRSSSTLGDGAIGQNASARSTASSTRSALGRYSDSSAAGGNGASKPDTRSTGASSE